MKTRTVLLAMLVVLFAGAAAQAGTISINFGSDIITNPPDAYAPQSGNWNNLAAGFAATGVIDSNGNVVPGMTVTRTRAGDGAASGGKYGYPTLTYTCVPGDVGYTGIKESSGTNNSTRITITGVPAGYSVAVLGGWYANGLSWDVVSPSNRGTHRIVTWAGQVWLSRLDVATGTYYYNQNSPDNTADNDSIHGIQILNTAQFLPETLVAQNSTWKYLHTTTGVDPAVSTTFMQKTFNDSGWNSAMAILHYNQSWVAPNGTAMLPNAAPNYTDYFRTTFNVTDPAKYTELLLHIARDDGAIVYLNGTEIVRSNVGGTVGVPPAWTQLASGSTPDDGQTYYAYTGISPTLLVKGTNVLAVSVHNQATGGDMNLDAVLTAKLNPNYHPIIPEPAGLGLIGLALLALRKRRS